jgi:hypothetical protein
MFPGSTLLFLGLALSLSLTTVAATGAGVPARDFPPLYLFLGALVPTLIDGAGFMLFR